MTDPAGPDRLAGDAGVVGDAGVLGVVRAHLDAFNARDVEAVVAGFADDAVFAAGDELVVGGRALRVLFAGAFAAPVAARLDLVRAVVEGDTAACELVERLGVGGGDALELPVAVFYTVRRGVLVRVRVYRDASG